MNPIIAFLLLVCGFASQDPAQKTGSAQRMEITLERQEGNLWKAEDPGHVFEKGDHVRFRFRANFDGYLYVMDYGTSGNYSLLFPHDETGRENRITSGKEYRIPATEAWFRIDGPPGHDVVYWMVSPIALESAGASSVPPPLPKAKRPLRPLLPKCDGSILRARGECVDSSAGLRNIPETDELPDNMAGISSAGSRELVIMRRDDSSTISSPVPLEGPIIYQFRLAHK